MLFNNTQKNNIPGKPKTGTRVGTRKKFLLMKKTHYVVLLFLAIVSLNHLFGQVPPSYVPTNNLVGWWPFNGNANDESGNGRHGTVHGATLCSDRNGNINNAYRFNGTSNYITAPGNTPFTNGLSISIWVKITGNNQNIDCNYGCSHFLVSRLEDRANGHFKLSYWPLNSRFGCDLDRFWMNTGLMDTISYPIPQISWQHVVMTYNNNRINLYINGRLANTKIHNSSIATINTPFYFGRHNQNSSFTYFLNGEMDDIGIWNRALDSCEVLGLYHMNRTYCCQSIIASNIINTSQTLCNSFQYNPITGSVPSGGNGTYAYQWQTSSDTINWTAVTGGTSRDLINGTVAGNTYFRRNVASGNCSNIRSNTVTVSPTIITNTIGAVHSICSTPTFSRITGNIPTGGPGPITYQWQLSSDGSIWTNITHGTADWFSSGLVFNNTYYRRLINSTPCTSISNTVLLTVLPSSGTIGNSQTICANTLSLNLTGTIATGGQGMYQYQWETSANQINWGSLPGSTGQNLLAVNNSTNTYYRRTVVSGSCPSVTSNVALISIQMPIVNQITTTEQTICSGSLPLQFTGMTPSGGSGIYAYQWQSSLDTITWSNIGGATDIHYNANPLTRSTWYRRNVSAGVCLQAESNTIRVRVDSAFQILLQPVNRSPRMGDSIHLVVTASSLNVSYQWQLDTGNGFFNITDTGQYTGTLTNLLVINSISQLNQNYRFRCIVTRGVCSETSLESEITINYNRSVLDTENEGITESEIILYPSTNNGEFHVKMEEIEAVEIKAYSLNGQEVRIEWVKESTSLKVNAIDAASGLYILRIHTEGGTVSKRWEKK